MNHMKEIIADILSKTSLGQANYARINYTDDINNYCSTIKGNEQLIFVEKLHYFLNGITTRVLCAICNKEYAKFGPVIHKVNGKYSHKVNQFKPCSPTCSKIHGMNQQALSRDIMVTNHKLAMKEKYGVENSMDLKQFRDKLKDSIQEKYGVKTVLLLPENMDKSKQTWKDNKEDILSKRKISMLEKYGVDHNFKIPEVIENRKANLVKKFGVDNYSKTNEFKEVLAEKKNEEFINSIPTDYELISYDKMYVTFIHKSCGKEFTMDKKFYHSRKSKKLMICSNCLSIDSNNSNAEFEIIEYIKSVSSTNIIHSYKDVERRNYEIDIFLPEYGVGIEYNGSHWHNSDLKDVNYHADKSKFFAERGIRIIHVYDFLWIYKKEIVKSIISNAVNASSSTIYARKCKIQQVPFQLMKEFLIENHLQGFSVAKTSIGLFYDDELVQIMTFGTSEKYGSWEIIRLATKKFVHVVGGTQRLFKEFRAVNPGDVMSFSYNDFFTGNIYEKLGMQKIGSTKPGYWYVHKRTLEPFSRNRMQKHKLDNSLGSTESEITAAMGLYKIYNCGSSIYKTNNERDGIFQNLQRR